MNLRNRVILIGDVQNNPEHYSFKSGNRLSKFIVSTTDVFQTKDNRIKQVMRHNVVAWNEVADNVKKQLTLGCEVVIDGHLVNRVYKDKSGEPRSISEVVADTFLTQSKRNVSEKRA